MTETHTTTAPCALCGRPIGRTVIRRDQEILSLTLRIARLELREHRDWPTLRRQLVDQLLGELDREYAEIRVEEPWNDTPDSSAGEASSTSSPK